MKIDGSSLHPTSPPKRGGRARDGARSGSFAEALGSGAAPQGASPASGGQVGGLDALLALQEVPDTSGGRDEARDQGERILDRLDDLRLDLLDGRLSSSSVQNLAAEIDAARSESDDPRLNEILDEIELRAHVELAKLGL
jgi:hypothetical protein